MRHAVAVQGSCAKRRISDRQCVSEYGSLLRTSWRRRWHVWCRIGSYDARSAKDSIPGVCHILRLWRCRPIEHLLDSVLVTLGDVDADLRLRWLKFMTANAVRYAETGWGGFIAVCSILPSLSSKFTELVTHAAHHRCYLREPIPQSDASGERNGFFARFCDECHEWNIHAVVPSVIPLLPQYVWHNAGNNRKSTSRILRIL